MDAWIGWVVAAVVTLLGGGIPLLRRWVLSRRVLRVQDRAIKIEGDIERKNHAINVQTDRDLERINETRMAAKLHREEMRLNPTKANVAELIRDSRKSREK